MKDMYVFEKQQSEDAAKAAESIQHPAEAAHIRDEFAKFWNAKRDGMLDAAKDVSVESITMTGDLMGAIGALDVAINHTWPMRCEVIDDRIQFLDAGGVPGAGGGSFDSVTVRRVQEERAQLVKERAKLEAQEKYLRGLLDRKLKLLKLA